MIKAKQVHLGFTIQIPDELREEIDDKLEAAKQAYYSRIEVECIAKIDEWIEKNKEAVEEHIAKQKAEAEKAKELITELKDALRSMFDRPDGYPPMEHRAAKPDPTELPSIKPDEDKYVN